MKDVCEIERIPIFIIIKVVDGMTTNDSSRAREFHTPDITDVMNGLQKNAGP